MINLSIIIPCYNESDSLPTLIANCRKACNGRDDIQIIFVNNGSTDNTQIILDQLLSSNENSFGQSIQLTRNKGYGYGILRGLENAKGKILAWTHADLQTDPIDVINIYERFKEDLLLNKSIVKGNRIGRKFLDNIFTKGMSIYSTLVLGITLDDINAQPKVFNRDFFTPLSDPPGDFSLDLFLLYQAKIGGLGIENFPVYFSDRKFGNAKGGGTIKGKIKLIIRTFKYIRKLKQRFQS